MKRYPQQIPLTDQQLRWCNQTLSSDALAAITLHKLATHQPCSVVRVGDAEYGILRAVETGQIAWFLKDKAWMTRMGLLGADLKLVARQTLAVAREADYFGACMAGLYRPQYNLYPLAPDRQFIDVFYTRTWRDRGWLPVILQEAKSLVIHREHEKIVQDLKTRYRAPDITGIPSTGWRDHAAIREAVGKSDANLILASVGSSGKYLLVELARDYGKIVLDVGNAMLECWCRDVPTITSVHCYTKDTKLVSVDWG